MTLVGMAEAVVVVATTPKGAVAAEVAVEMNPLTVVTPKKAQMTIMAMYHVFRISTKAYLDKGQSHFQMS